MTIVVDNEISLEIVHTRHAQAIFDLVERDREYLAAWLPWVRGAADVRFIQNFISHNRQAFADKTDFAFVIYCDGEIVGRIGVYKIDHQNRIGSIGYWLSDEAQGRGIVTRSCKALIHYCFTELDLNRIEIKCGTENFKSQAIAERLGFTKEGIVRQGEAFHDKFIDLYSYSLLRRDRHS